MKCQKCKHQKPTKAKFCINLDICVLFGKLCTELDHGRECDQFDEEVSDEEQL